MLSDPRSGSRVGPYRLVGVIGRGGMSTVYRAEHAYLGRHVALKVLAERLRDDDTLAERFLRESRLAASLEHPHVVPIYDAGEADGQLYVAMRLVEGRSLREALACAGPLTGARTVAVVSEIASALDSAHARGLVHRDVKPENILLDAVGVAHLVDFGVARLHGATNLTKTNQFVGTQAYAAPEQFEGADVDARTDEYALACVAYECLTGTAPFLRDSEASTMRAHLLEPPPALPDDVDVPRAVGTVLECALGKLPADRYASCGAFATAFAEAVATPEQAAAVADAVRAVTVIEPARALPAPAVPPARPRRRRHILALAGAGILVVGGAAAAYALRGPGATPTRRAASSGAPRQTSSTPATPSVTTTTATLPAVATTPVAAARRPTVVRLSPLPAHVATPTTAITLSAVIRSRERAVDGGRCSFERQVRGGRFALLGNRPVSRGACALRTTAGGAYAETIGFRVRLHPSSAELLGSVSRVVTLHVDAAPPPVTRRVPAVVAPPAATQSSPQSPPPDVCNGPC